MTNGTTQRDRSDTTLRWIAAALAVAVFALAAGCGPDAGGAGHARDSPEMIRVATAPSPQGSTALPERAAPSAPTPNPAPTAPTARPQPAPLPEPPPYPTPSATFHHALSAFHAGRHGEAIDLFAQYVDREPTEPRGHYMLGIAAWKGGHLDLAEAHLLESTLIDPAHVHARVNLARVLIELGQPHAAEHHARAAQELAPEHVAAKRTLARALAEAGDTEAALAEYDEALWIEPHDRWSLNNMGYLMIQLGRHADAVGPLALAVHLDGANPLFRNNLNGALVGAGLRRDVDTDALARAYLEELWGCPGERADTAVHHRPRGMDDG